MQEKLEKKIWLCWELCHFLLKIRCNQREGFLFFVSNMQKYNNKEQTVFLTKEFILYLRMYKQFWHTPHSDSDGPIVSNKSDLSIFDFLNFYWFKYELTSCHIIIHANLIPLDMIIEKLYALMNFGKIGFRYYI